MQQQKQYKVLLIGETCEDSYIFGSVDRISPEAPIPVFKPTSEESNGGMAKNVADNVESLDMHIHTVTNKNNITKIRFVENRSSQMVLRVDEQSLEVLRERGFLKPGSHWRSSNDPKQLPWKPKVFYFKSGCKEVVEYLQKNDDSFTQKAA